MPEHLPRRPVIDFFRFLFNASAYVSRWLACGNLTGPLPTRWWKTAFPQDTKGDNWYAYCGSNLVNIVDQDGRIAGFDDWLNEEAEDATASVETRNAVQRRVGQIVEKYYKKYI